MIGADATWFEWGSFGGMSNRHKRLPSGSSVCVPLLRYSLVCLRNVLVAQAGGWLSLPPACRTGIVPRGRLHLESGHSVG